MSSLTFRFIANACGVFTGNRGTKILCDPWLIDGVFEGSWCHYPPIQSKPEDFSDVDAIYISHIHPDHFDERNFRFPREMPIILLEHGPNFLKKKLNSLGFSNLISIKDGESRQFKEFEITLLAPFAKHVYHEALVGNLIDSALYLRSGSFSALNTNDNTPTVQAAQRLLQMFGSVDLLMLNYNAAGPYPSCFNNLTQEEKYAEHSRILHRNFKHMRDVVLAMQPRFVLPFAGSYLLGGEQAYKNPFLGTTTWDECGAWLNRNGVGDSKVVLLRENDVFCVETGAPTREYEPIDPDHMRKYYTETIASLKYPHEFDPLPDESRLVSDVEKAASKMLDRMARFKLNSEFVVSIDVYGKKYAIYPEFCLINQFIELDKKLECKLDERLLRRILDRQAHWNNAEIGAHIDFNRVPNVYEPDLHTSLQFFHL